MIYVDNYRIPATVKGRLDRWSHLIAFPANIEELVEFGKKIGLKREWLQHPDNPARAHFDVTDSKRQLALQSGAMILTTRDLGMLVLIMQKVQQRMGMKVEYQMLDSTDPRTHSNAVKIKELDELDVARLKVEHPEIDQIVEDARRILAERRTAKLRVKES